MKVQWPLLLSLLSCSLSLSLRGGCVWPWPKPFQRPRRRRRRHATAAVATPKVQCPFARLSSSLLPSLPCFFPLLAAAILLLSSLFFLLHKLWIVLILLVLGLQKTMYPLHSSIDWPSNFFTTPLWKKGWNFFLKVSKFWKQIFLFSFEPKNERRYFFFLFQP